MSVFRVPTKGDISYQGRGSGELKSFYTNAVGVESSYNTITSVINVCSDSPSGSFSPEGSAGSNVRKTVESNRYDMYEILKSNGQNIQTFHIDKPAGDKFESFKKGNFLVAVWTLGGDHVLERLQGDEYVFEITPGDGIKKFYIYYLGATLPSGFDQGSEVTGQMLSAIYELDPISVSFDQTGQLSNITIKYTAGGWRTFFFTNYDQDNIFRDYHSTGPQGGDIYSSSVTTSSNCTVQLNWIINRVTGSDLTGAYSFTW